MPYDGGKSQSGVWQWIINRIPVHTTFVELFAGSAAIARLKLPAAKTILVEKSVSQADWLRAEFGDRAEVINADALTLLHQLNDSDAVVYADPTYVLSTRGGRRYYEHELSDAEHVVLGTAARAAKCKFMLSGYESALYDAMGFSTQPAAPWSCDTRRVMTRGHTWATECLWFNFPRPTVIHDTRRVGDNRRERWRIEKRRRAWRKMFAAMGTMEREAIFAVLSEVRAYSAKATKAGGSSAADAVEGVKPSTRARGTGGRFARATP